jgi:hypothetical protein
LISYTMGIVGDAEILCSHLEAPPDSNTKH